MSQALSKGSTGGSVIRIENEFLFNSFFHLHSAEFTAIMYFVSTLDPFKQKRFHEQIISATDLIERLEPDTKKWGGAYSYLRDLVGRLQQKNIRFREGYEIVDKITGKAFDVDPSSAINWFQYILVLKSKEDGRVYIKFCFSEVLKPFLLQLNQYLVMGGKELDGLTTGYGKHLYSILKAYRNKTRKDKTTQKVREESIYKVEYEDLKKIMGVGEKYDGFKHFNYNVLKPTVKRIVKDNNIQIAVTYRTIREGRKVKWIEFRIRDRRKTNHEGTVFVPSEEDVNNLTFAQRLAYIELVNFGVTEGIAFKQLLPSIKGSEFAGFEDYFVKYAIGHFKNWAKQPNAGVLVKWWHEKKVFDTSSDVWSQILEKVVTAKKKLENTNPEAFSNRHTAKKMTYVEFLEWHKKLTQS